MDADYSHDGTNTAFRTDPNGSKAAIYVMNADGTAQTRLTNNTADDTNPAWRPDGKIVFNSDREGPPGTFQVYVMNADGTGQTKVANSTGAERPAWRYVDPLVPVNWTG